MSDPYVPSLVHPTAPNANPVGEVKTVADTATPEYLASIGVPFRELTLFGEKAFGVSNATDVILQVRDTNGVFQDARTIAPGEVVTWDIPEDRPMNGQSFKIKVATNGDGLRYIGA